MTETLHTVELTNLEISTILYYIEGGVQGIDESEIEPEVYSIFQKLENIKLHKLTLFQFVNKSKRTSSAC